MTTSAINPELATALVGIPGFERYSQPPIAPNPISSELSAALKGIPNFEHYTSNPPSTSGGRFTRQSLSAAGHKIGDKLSEAKDWTKDRVKNNADFLSGLIAGGAVSFGVAAGLHRPDLAITFPMLYSIIGETIPRALVGVYQGIEHFERSRLGRPLIGIGNRGLGKDFTAERYYKLQNGVVGRVMNGLSRTIANRTYNRVMAGVLTGGVTGAVLGGALEFSHQIQAAHANQPAAPQQPDSGGDHGHPGFIRNQQPAPDTNPATLPEVKPTTVIPNIPLGPGEAGITLPPSPTLTETVKSLPTNMNVSAVLRTPAVVTTLGHEPYYWNAAQNWIQPLSNQLHLSPQAQLYLTDAVTDVIKNQGPIGQVQNMQFDLAAIAKHITGAISIDTHFVAAGNTSAALKGLTVDDLKQIGQAAEEMLKIVGGS